ncbi:MAG TPA: TRAP transporter substrate-binding protein [Stellaceae bacterium]|nr:TRAP transporter substrate-binding protein [Stellaceae bacterium]
MKQKIIAAVLVAASVAIAPVRSRAAEPVLKFANPGSPTGDVSKQIIEPWIAKVNQEAAGMFRVQHYPGPALGQFPQIYDRVLNGVADFAFGLLGPISRQFPKTSVASLPFETPNATIGTVALWHVYERGLLTSEWQQVKPLTLMVFPNVVVHTKKPIHNLADIGGLKLSVQSRLLSDTMHQLGVAPITLAVTDLYESLNRGVIDGAVIGWPATRSYRLAEVTNNHLEVPLGGEVTFVMMNNKTYAKLLEKGRAIIDKNSLGPWATAIGKILDGDDRAESKIVAETKGQSVATLSPAEQAKWKARVDSVVEDWVKRTPNGAAVLAAYRDEVAKLSKK